MLIEKELPESPGADYGNLGSKVTRSRGSKGSKGSKGRVGGGGNPAADLALCLRLCLRWERRGFAAPRAGLFAIIITPARTYLTSPHRLRGTFSDTDELGGQLPLAQQLKLYSATPACICTCCRQLISLSKANCPLELNHYEKVPRSPHAFAMRSPLSPCVRHAFPERQARRSSDAVLPLLECEQTSIMALRPEAQYNQQIPRLASFAEDRREAGRVSGAVRDLVG